MTDSNLLQFVNCRILRNHKIINDDIWVRNGKIIDPEKVFFDEKIEAHTKINCNGFMLVPGFIDIQINGGFGHDFSHNLENLESGLEMVSRKLLGHGVTAYCPTVVTSPSHIYHTSLKQMKKRPGGRHGATILGLHTEGPFINVEKKGAHPQECIRPFLTGFKDVEDMYSSFDNIKIVTLAPELTNSEKVIKELRKRGIVVSLGHSMANLSEGEKAVQNGASLITHLFNAMLPFHHRDPGLVGLLTSDAIPPNRTVYFGIIADGVHTHPAALRIAYRVHPHGLILVTDAISALGLNEGRHKLGQLSIEVRDSCAYIAGTETLCGSIASMLECVRIFRRETGCTIEFAFEAASLHPATALGIEGRKGALSYGADADFLLLNDELELQSTWIAGECVFKN